MPLVIGIPKEIKPRERRVGMTPEAVARLSAAGLSVAVQETAGEFSGYTDEAYRSAGARLVPDIETLYATSGLIQKVKEPQPAEFPLLRSNHVLFGFLHLASPENAEVVKALEKSGATAIGFETLEVEGMRPILKPMSEIAGALSAAYASYFISLGWQGLPDISEKSFENDLQSTASLYPEVPSHLKLSRVVIWGGGVAGELAMRFALKLGARVTLVEKNPDRAAALKRNGGQNLNIVLPDQIPIEDLEKAEVFIGCVHHTGAKAFHVISPEELSRASSSKKKVIMDVAIDQGGNFPRARATTYVRPVYLDEFGNLRFSVANIPSFCGAEATKAITQAAFPYTEAIARDFDAALARYPELVKAVNARAGRIVIDEVRAVHRK